MLAPLSETIHLFRVTIMCWLIIGCGLYEHFNFNAMGLVASTAPCG